MRVALRTQQVIAHETGVTNTIDPLGGSYFVEALTDQLEAHAYAYFAKIDELGGMVEAVKRGFPQREIADAAYTLQQEYDRRDRILVGVNDFTEGGEGELEPCTSTRPWSASRSTACRASAPAATARPSSRPSAVARGGGRRCQPDAEPLDCARVHARGRDRREPSAGLRYVHGNTGLLGAGTHAQADRHALKVVELPRPWPAASGDQPVKVGDDYYVRSRGVPVVTVKKGTTVKWNFRGSNPHPVTVSKGRASSTPA